MIKLGQMVLKGVNWVHIDKLSIMSLASLLATIAGTNIIETAIVFVH